MMFFHALYALMQPSVPRTEATTTQQQNVLPPHGGAMQQQQQQEVDQDVLLARVLQEQERAFHAMLMAQIGSPVNK